ncbi:MAG TPA: hypothetical protein VGJ05_07820 [Fimbriiglobus sp.]|jgi:hypothetical protein
MNIKSSNYKYLVIINCTLFFFVSCNKQPKAVAAKVFDRQAFSFNYPATWKIDDKDADFDADHMFSIDASDSAMIIFTILEEKINPHEALSLRIERQKKQIREEKRSSFSHWGTFDGSGVLLYGKTTRNVDVSLRIFVFNSANKTFAITEYAHKNEMQMLAGGYQMIESSFRIK